MVHKLTIALATVSAIALGSTLSASAHSMHGMGTAGFHSFHATSPNFMHPGMASPSFVHPGFHHHHRFFHDRFFFAGDPVFYYDDGCIERVWTHRGWRWVNICY